MDPITTGEIISTVGFPIAMTIFLLWNMHKTDKANEDRLDRLQEAHRAENKEIVQAVHNNTLALTALTALLPVNLGALTEGKNHGKSLQDQ